MKTKEGEPVSVKTDTPIPKEKMFELMKIINNKKAEFLSQNPAFSPNEMLD